MKVPEPKTTKNRVHIDWHAPDREGEVSHLDGISIEAEDWHLNVRPSNTEPLLRLNLDARSKELMEQKRDEVLAIMR